MTFGNLIVSILGILIGYWVYSSIKDICISYKNNHDIKQTTKAFIIMCFISTILFAIGIIINFWNYKLF